MTDAHNPAPDDLPRMVLREDDPLRALLRQWQMVLLRYPEAASAIISALVAEGRAFAATEAGQQARERLAGSELAKQGRLIWQAYGLDRMVTEQVPARTPSEWLTVLLRILSESDLEAILTRLMVEEAWYGTINRS